MNIKIKIAFYLENTNIPDIDLSKPSHGNPGCGGTEYLFVALPYYIHKYLKKNDYEHLIEVIILAEHTQKLPSIIKSFKVTGVKDAAKTAKNLNVDFFIYRPRRHENENLLKFLDELKLPTIGWAHVTPNDKYLRDMSKSFYFKALVCVEHEQYDQIQDTKLSCVSNKCSFIVNGFDVKNFQIDKKIEKDTKLVVYLGALVIQKGFHKLAKIWPNVVKRVPEAKLIVIGSAKVYNQYASLGNWNIAEKSYEEKYIIPFLSDNCGKPIKSVTFAGRLGNEKKQIIAKALIGVPNPTGSSENCPGSALEFQALGTAVVSGAYWGILDTVLNKKTGLLGKSEKDLENDLVYLLNNPSIAKSLGQRGVSFVEQKYNWNKVVSEWINLFQVLKFTDKIHKKPFKKNYFTHFKYLIFINHIIQKILGRYIFWPSINEIKMFLLRLKNKLLNKKN